MIVNGFYKNIVLCQGEKKDLLPGPLGIEYFTLNAFPRMEEQEIAEPYLRDFVVLPQERSDNTISSHPFWRAAVVHRGAALISSWRG
jgi:hypothetical protein